MPALLGVACIDMNLIVVLDTMKARDDWTAFHARVKREREACPRVTITEPQVRTAIPNPVPVPIPNPTPIPIPIAIPIPPAPTPLPLSAARDAPPQRLRGGRVRLIITERIGRPRLSLGLGLRLGLGPMLGLGSPLTEPEPEPEPSRLR